MENLLINDAAAIGTIDGPITAAQIEDWLAKYIAASPDNLINESYALRPDIVGVPLFRTPIVGCASADDPYLQRVHDEEKILGPAFRLPQDWLPGAKSIISICYPFSDEVCESNLDNIQEPSDCWLHGRIEGHDFIHATDLKIKKWLEDQGYRAVIPALSPEMQVLKREPEEAVGVPMFRSSWSERHIAFTAGLGTFGLCAHLITPVGKAARFGSIITDAPVEVTQRPYGEEPYAYCTMCGACTKRCPVDALSVEKGKDFQPCWRFLEDTKIWYKPRYGCGKCQLQVPCERGIPNPKFSHLNR